MKTEEIKVILQLIRNDKVTRLAAIAVLACSFLIASFFNVLSGLIVLCSYVLGFVACGFLLRYQEHANVLFHWFEGQFKGHFASGTKKAEDFGCGVCSEEGCDRHSYNNRMPWKHFLIDTRLNDALEHFLTRIIDQFISSWYINYTSDRSFINEIKHSVRFASSRGVKRFLELEVGRIITGRLIPCAIKHVDDYLCMKQIAELRNVEVNKIAVEYLGKRLHIAASNRKNEIKYLRHLSTALIEKVLPGENLKCRNYVILIREIMAGWVLLPLMDVLADPNIINYLVILIATYRPKSSYPSNEAIENVEFLKNYTSYDSSRSALGTDLKSILKNQDMLYAFMQFLKKENAVHLLNFCLDVEAFNGKLYMPDLSKKQLEDLHTDALNIYRVYMDNRSESFIGCSPGIVTNLNKLLEDGVYHVAKLQTSEPLFQAYDFAFSRLENQWMAQFHHSNEFYNFICGSKMTAGYTKVTAKSPFIIQGSPIKVRQRKYVESGLGGQGAVAKISSGFGRIRGALQMKQPIEGALAYPSETKILNSDGVVEDHQSENATSSASHRDLSAWRITIPTVETHQSGGKPVQLFNISIQRVDHALGENENRRWTVRRRDQDFYTLKAKLIEFHGESEFCKPPLPSKRSLLSVDIRKIRYEEFLQALIEKQLLKGSDLLHTFLTTPQDFTSLVNSSMAVVDLENIYQSVTHKFRKEKGQHLDSFMNTFLGGSGKQRATKFEWAEVGDEINPLGDLIIYPKTMHNKVFGDNFSVNYKQDEESSSSSINPNGITESIFYLLKHIFKVPNGILKLYVAVCSVAKQAVESMTRIFIERKIKSALSQPTLTFLVRQLEEVIFGKHIPTSPEQFKERKDRAFNELEKSIPGLIDLIFGKDLKIGAAALLDILQNPQYNKQLAYNLIDIVAAEMYPELDNAGDVLN